MRFSLVVSPLLVSSAALARPASSKLQNALKNELFKLSKTVEMTFGWYDVKALDNVLYDGDKDQTMYQFLKSNDDFSKLVKLIDYDEDTRKMLDKCSDKQMTFFAPNNDALNLPSQRDPTDSFSQLLAYIDDDDDKNRNRNKKIFGQALHEVLMYHMLPYEVKTTTLGTNSTVETALKARDGSFDSKHRRIKVERTVMPPSLTINKYVRVIQNDIEMCNGMLNVVNRPLIPPGSVLDTAHMLPQLVSTFTSAVQKVRLENILHFRSYFDKEKDRDETRGTPTVTVFAPTNEAFTALPSRLLLYLFSPFGERALKKIILFHTIPDHIIHADWIHEAKGSKHHRFHSKDAEFEVDRSFQTGLRGQEMNVRIVKTLSSFPGTPKSANYDFTVEGQKVIEMDLVARNGAMHTIPMLLDPRPEDERSEGGWENWESWLPEWAEESY